MAEPYLLPVNLYIFDNQLPSTGSDYSLVIGGNTLRLQQPRTPENMGAAGHGGEICYDENYLYLYTTRWCRIPLDKTEF